MRIIMHIKNMLRIKDALAFSMYKSKLFAAIFNGVTLTFIIQK